MKTDVAIIGGGPAGATVGTLVKKYRPDLDVTILEREVFPRDHVGESHLPAISAVLDEMGVWDKVEAAGFPVKVGATFKWGSREDLWHTDFLVGEKYEDLPRPAKFVGQRAKTAYQVDRSVYDKILLDHAAAQGCRVHQGTGVRSVGRDGDFVTGLVADPGLGEVEAKYYVDASGDSGVLRRALDIGVDSPTKLRNIAVWKYWNDAEWAETIGKGATRVQILSLGWGWVWFIPITTTRTSVGLVMPASHYRESGLSTEALYTRAIQEEPMVAKLLARATPEPALSATKDWSFVADRLAGANWFLAGDACGFADPILSAGMTLAHTGARKVAFTVLELERGETDPEWLKHQYDEGHRGQIRHHMQFADYWYSSNGHFVDLKNYCAEIASEAGVSLTPEDAFRWLATGGFTLDTPGVAAALTYRLRDIKYLTAEIVGERWGWELAKTNTWKLNREGTKKGVMAEYVGGRVRQTACLRRGAKVLPIMDVFKHLLNALHRETDSIRILEATVNAMVREDQIEIDRAPMLVVEAMEAMVTEGWIIGTLDPDRPCIKVH
ncbi:MAG: tryptophan 7-halogenase [Fimbriimonadaceae bacterium]|nr:tryptophan 7-halogenase [Fimbriimonadaceae bacterium]